MTTTDKLAKDFINGNATDSNASYSFHYSNGMVFSYGTLIGKLDTDKNVLFITDKGLTTTTTKHKGLLVNHALAKGLKIVEIPVRMNDGTFPTDDEVFGRFEARMDKVAMGTELAVADNRKEFANNFDRYKEFATLVGKEPKFFKRYEELNENIQNTTFVRRLQAKRREFNKRQQELYMEVVNNRELFR